MTQKALAGEVGVSRQTMNAIENGRHAPTIAVAIKIADVFGVSVDELFAFDYDGKPEHRPIVTQAAPTQPAYRIERAPQASISRKEPVQPNEPSGQSSMKKAPQDQKALLASLRNVVG